MPEPWRSHALSCLTTEAVTTSHTMVVVGMQPKGTVACSAWVSLPDLRLLLRSRHFAFLQHVNVEARFRGNGLGSRLVGFACSVADAVGIRSVLLAAADPDVRTRFYSRIGFQPVRTDPWLMLRDPEVIDAGSGHSADAVHEGPPLLRAASMHDLATVQSICAQPHWKCGPDGVHYRDAEECEEEFCGQFVRKETALGARQFLVRSPGRRVKCISWSRLERGNWHHRILAASDIEDLVHDTSASLARVLAQVCRRSDDQLRLDVAEKLLLLDQ
jgi:hypothetical protein